MSQVKIQGNASGTGVFTIAAPNSNTDRTLTLPDQTGTVLTNTGPFTANASTANGALTLDANSRMTLGTSQSNNAAGIGLSNNSKIQFRTAADNGWVSGLEFTSGNVMAVANTGFNVTLGGSGGQIQFAGTAATIDSSGNLLVGTTGTLNTTSSGQYIATGSASYHGVGHNGTASGTSYTAYYYNSSYIGGITQNGTTAVSYNTTSDYRLKENVRPMTGALARVAALKPCTYTWKAAPDEIGEGFIAHELAEVCPQAVTGEKDAVDADGNPVYQGIDTSFLVATLTAAIQEQQAQIEALKARLDALEAPSNGGEVTQ